MTQSSKPSQKTTRERAAQARAKAEAEARRRDNRNRLIGGVVVVVLVGLIFGGVWYSKKDSAPVATPGAVPSASPDPSAALPVGVDKATYGVPFGTGAATVPQLQIWEDFQCPICGELERTNGAAIEAMATAGTVRLLWRPANIIDGNYGTTFSQQATAAWGCAIDAGKTEQFHNTVYANQPTTEGTGWTQDQLLAFGKDAGITGDAYTTYEACVKANTYTGWAANSFQAFHDAGVSGTPTAYLVLGDKTKELTNDVLADPTKLKAAVESFQSS